jgi:hypothetical protein
MADPNFSSFTCLVTNFLHNDYTPSSHGNAIFPFTDHILTLIGRVSK